MPEPRDKLLSAGTRWAENNKRKIDFQTCILCHKLTKEDQEVEIVYTKRKEWILFHTKCFEKEVSRLWRH